MNCFYSRGIQQKYWYGICVTKIWFVCNEKRESSTTGGLEMSVGERIIQGEERGHKYLCLLEYSKVKVKEISR